VNFGSRAFCQGFDPEHSCCPRAGVSLLDQVQALFHELGVLFFKTLKIGVR
jgi:hypothetical protein